ncbi:MAG TPA: class I SAM-dependent methyltransferase [Gaiellaceae bacterium]|nr:class I SAM-dependent methyltransferase [Gaiellaceae bacterium]
MSEWEWDPETYLGQMADEIPGYEELQVRVAAATAGVRATRVLELGTGTGETALRVQADQPGARWVGIDSSEAMLARARERLPGADLRLQRLEDELPTGPFDLVVSALAVHHLDGAGKRGLFSRVARVVRPGGHFVLGDVVVPPAGQEGPIYIDWAMDTPDTVEDQLTWLREAGFEAEASGVRVDLAVFRARLIAP